MSAISKTMPSPSYATATAVALTPLGPALLLIAGASGQLFLLIGESARAQADSWTLMGGATVAAGMVFAGQYFKVNPFLVGLCVMASVFGGWIGTPAYLHIASWAGWLHYDDISREVMALLAVPGAGLTIALAVMIMALLFYVVKLVLAVLGLIFPAINEVASFTIFRGSIFALNWVRSHIPGNSNDDKTLSARSFWNEK